MRIPWRFLGRWVLGTAAGIVTGTKVLIALLDQALSRGLGFHAVPSGLLLLTVVALAGLVQGTVVGAFQGLSIRTLGIGTGRWTVCTAPAAGLAWAAACALQLLFLSYDVGPQEELIAFVVTGFGIGAVIGVAQWLLLRNRMFRGAAWWIVANGAAWVVGTSLVTVVAERLGGSLISALAVGALGALGVGLAVGLITALALAVLVGGVGSFPRGALTLIERRRYPRAAA